MWYRRVSPRPGDIHRLYEILEPQASHPFDLLCHLESQAPIPLPGPCNRRRVSVFREWIQQSLGPVRVEEARITLPRPPYPASLRLAVSLERRWNALLPGIYEGGIGAVQINFDVKENDLYTPMQILAGPRNTAVWDRPLAAGMRTYWMLVDLGERQIVSVSFEACVTGYPRTERDTRLCIPVTIDLDVSVDLEIEWPRGPPLPHATLYPLVREVWVIGPNRAQDLVLAGDDLVISSITPEPARGVLEDALGAGARIMCREAHLDNVRGRIYKCPPIRHEEHGYLGPFLIVEGTRTEDWDPEEADKMLLDTATSEAPDYAVLPLAFLKSRPAMVLPITFGGPLGLAYHRGIGIRLGGERNDKILDRKGRLLLKLDDTGGLLPVNPRKGLLAQPLAEMMRAAYVDENSLFLWGIFDTPLGPRPGPPQGLYSMIGFEG